MLLLLIRTSRIKEGIDTVLEVALKEGYKLFDTAHSYCNEAEIGKALQKFFRDGIIIRKDIFITSKLRYMLEADRIFQCWITYHEYVCKQSLTDRSWPYIYI